MATSPAGKPMRKNARANRERILVAAEAVFGARGELGSTEDVADQARVGIATVFRHFPTKDALIEAVVVRLFNRLNEQAVQSAGDPDPGHALRQLIATMIETSSTKVTLLSLVRDHGRLPPVMVKARQELEATIGAIIARAKSEGIVRDDVAVDELFVLVRGLAQANATMPAPPATLSRAIEIICRGLAPPDRESGEG